MSIRIRTAVLAAMLASAAFTASASAADKVKVGIDAAYAPFAFVEPSGDLAGYEVELVKAVCAEMQADCEISNVPWDGIFAALDSGSIQWIGTGITITDKRKAQYTMSDTVYRVGLAMIVKSDATAASYDDLKGKTVGTLASTEPWYAFTRAKLGEDVDIRGYDSMDAAVLDLDADRIAAVIGDNLQLQDQFVAKGAYKFVAAPEYGPEYTGAGRGWAFPLSGSEDLVAKVNAALKEVVADGTHAKLGEKYFKTAVPAN
jgi:ABC-type amino acid transport substrate-binding protein